VRISQIELRNFRGIRHGRITLPTHAVLLGANNSGKTTIVEALALLFGRDRMLRPVSDWDFYGGVPKPESRFHIVATITGFPSDDARTLPGWFVGEHAGRPVWWHDDTEIVSFESDCPDGAWLAAQVALTGRYDDEACEFELARYFYGRRNFGRVSRGSKRRHHFATFLMPRLENFNRSFSSSLPADWSTGRHLWMPCRSCKAL
jgi:hypothetical protein